MNLFIPGYSIERLIKEGGFGTVYQAKRAIDRQTVAIKMLNPAPASHWLQREEFYHEVKLLKSLNHPYIVKTYGVIQGTPRPAMCMEYFESETLKTLILQKSTILGDKGIGIFRKICESLQYLHSLKIVHKDIKPENILVNAQGEVRLIDFSIAEKLSFFSMFKPRRREGTPLYMAPEQIQCKRPDARTDIFALGAAFYEAFSGRAHLTAPSDKALLQQQLKAPVTKMRAFNKKIPYQLDSIILRMLKKRPEERFQSISEILFELNKFATSDILYQGNIITEDEPTK